MSEFTPDPDSSAPPRRNTGGRSRKPGTELPLFQRTRQTEKPQPIPNARVWLGPLVGLLMMLGGIFLFLPQDIRVAEEVVALPVDRSLPTVVVDAGHGGVDKGATANGLREKDLTLDVALRLERMLRQRGFPVVMTRRSDTFPTLEERTRIANAVPRALFVSIHFNDSNTGAGIGIETYYASEKVLSAPVWTLAGWFGPKPEPPPQDNGAAFAQTIQSTVIKRLGAVDRGAKPEKLFVVRRTRCPAVLVEGGFLNNATEARSIAREDYRETLAGAIAEGLALYYYANSSDISRFAKR